MTALADVTDPRFTDDQRAVVARFDAAPTPPEVVEARVVEEVARAMAEAQGVGRTATPLARHIATAAVAVYRAAQDGGAEEAVRRVSVRIETREHAVIPRLPDGQPVFTMGSWACICGARGANGSRGHADHVGQAADAFLTTLAPQAGDACQRVELRGNPPERRDWCATHNRPFYGCTR